MFMGQNFTKEFIYDFQIALFISHPEFIYDL